MQLTNPQNAVELYRIYNSIRLHFNNHSYNYRVGSEGNRDTFTRESFNLRPERMLYDKMYARLDSVHEHKAQIELIIAAYQFKNPNSFFPEFVDNFDAALKLWRARVGYMNAPVRQFQADLQNHFFAAETSGVTPFAELLVYQRMDEDGFEIYCTPQIVSWVISGRLQVETALILNRFLPWVEGALSKAPLSTMKIPLERYKKLEAFYEFSPEQIQKCRSYWTQKHHESARMLQGG